MKHFIHSQEHPNLEYALNLSLSRGFLPSPRFHRAHPYIINERKRNPAHVIFGDASYIIRPESRRRRPCNHPVSPVITKARDDARREKLRGQLTLAGRAELARGKRGKLSRPLCARLRDGNEETGRLMR